MPTSMNRCHRWATRSLGPLLLLALACDGDEPRAVTSKTAPLVPGPADKAIDEAPTKKSTYTELDAVPGAGVIQGTVTYTGNAQPGKLDVTKDTRVCTHGGEADGSLQVENGKLANAVVAITDDIQRGKRWESDKAVVDNRECRFEPRVQIGRYQGAIEMKNSDPVFHNTNLAPIANADSTTLVNVPLPLQGQSQTKKLEKPGIVAVNCNVHEWMKAWIYVSEHPYAAVTRADGTYEITGVPAGEYNALVWHEKLGQVSAKVKVESGGTATLDPVFK
jgi:plastocyanin